VEEVHSVVDRVACSVTNLAGEQERLMKKPIDILCFGRAGVGKTTLLEALTGRNLGSTPRLDHGTTKLECCEIKEILPRQNGDTVPINLRFWDSRGIESWNGDDVPKMFDELKRNEVYPLCVFYCANGNGRVDSAVVTEIIRTFIQKDVVVFYLITNVFNHNNEQLNAQFNGGKEVMRKATERSARDLPGVKYGWQFHEKSFLLAVNSKEYSSLLGRMESLNIQKLMEICVSTLDEEQLTRFFLATLHNRTFWDKAFDTLRTVLLKLERVGINTRSFLQRIWDLGDQVFQFLDSLFKKMNID